MPNRWNAMPNGWDAMPNGFFVRAGVFCSRRCLFVRAGVLTERMTSIRKRTKPAWRGRHAERWNAMPNRWNAMPNGWNAMPNGFFVRAGVLTERITTTRRRIKIAWRGRHAKQVERHAERFFCSRRCPHRAHDIYP